MGKSENGIRIVISTELNEKLLNLEKELKAKGYKGITRKKLFTDLCMSGLEFQKLSGQEIGGFASTKTGVKNPVGPKTPYVIETEMELSDWQNALSQKENRLMNRELNINVREEFINCKVSQYYLDKDDLIDEKEQLQQKPGIEKQLHEKIKTQGETIAELKNENKKLNSEIISLLKRIDKNTKKDVIKDELLPLATTILAGIAVYQNYKAQNKPLDNQNFPELMENFTNLLRKEQPELVNDNKNSTKKPLPSDRNPKKG